MKYNKEEEMERIDQLVFQFQKGDEKAGEELLFLFGCHPSQEDLGSFIGKYYKMLRYGRFNFDDRDSRKFLIAFIADKSVQEAMKKWFQYADTMRKARLALQQVNNKLEAISDDDLKQDLRMLFIQQAMRYKKIRKKVGFTGYLYNSYRYAVIHYIRKLFKTAEPLVHFRMKRAHEDVVVDQKSYIKIDDSIFVKEPIIEIDDELGNSWIRGLTCGEEFQSLTPLQRLILKLYYDEGYTDGEIGEKLNMHINTVFRQRKKASLKVQEEVKRLMEEEYDE